MGLYSQNPQDYMLHSVFVLRLAPSRQPPTMRRGLAQDATQIPGIVGITVSRSRRREQQKLVSIYKELRAVGQHVHERLERERAPGRAEETVESDNAGVSVVV